MNKQDLILHLMSSGTLRTVIKNRHGRLIYMELTRSEDRYKVIDCYYIDRIRNGKYYASPKKLKTRSLTNKNILSVIANELDRKYNTMMITYKLHKLNRREFIDTMLREYINGYKFLILIGEGKTVNGIPEIVKTRFKNRIHRSIYIRMEYAKDGKGVVSDCHYYDRDYKSRSSVRPETLTSIFFRYDRKSILDMVNRELKADFTDIIFVTDGTIDISDKTPICGNI